MPVNPGALPFLLFLYTNGIFEQLAGFPEASGLVGEAIGGRLLRIAKPSLRRICLVNLRFDHPHLKTLLTHYTNLILARLAALSATQKLNLNGRKRLFSHLAMDRSGGN